MTIDALWLQEIDYPARIDRTLYDSIWTEGIMGSGDLQVTQSSPTGMSVNIAVGVCAIEGDDQPFQGKYLVRSDAVETNLPIGVAPGSGTRHDLVVLRVRDSNAAGGLFDDAIFEVVAGTPSGSPVDPAIPNTALVLARVRVAAGTSAITNSLIDDLRVRANSNYDFLADNTITSAKLVNGTIVDADINASAGIAATKLGSGVLPATVTVGSANFTNSYVPGEAVFTIPGIVATGARTLRYYCEQARTISNVVASAGVAPTGASLIFDVNLNGTTIFTTQANRPTITTSTFYDASSVPNVTSVSAGDYLTVDVDQVGSTIPGSDAVIKIVFG